MYSKSTMILIFAVALISLTCGSPIDSAETRADTFSRTEKLNDKFTVSWDVDRKAETVKFTVVADTEGYVGLGFSETGTMENADIVIGGVKPDKSIYFEDRFASGHGVPPVDDKQDYTDFTVTEVGGKTTLVFTRKFVTGDDKDVDITDKKTNFIWAIGSTDDIAHHAERGSFAVNILEEDTFSRTEKLNDKYTVSWDVDRKTQIVKFTVVADTEGYVGLGFADSGSMTNADIVIGGVKPDKSTYFEDRFAAGHVEPVVDDQQDYTLISATEDAGKTTLVFTRKFVTGDDKDADITDKKTNFIWAIGSTDDIAKHAERGSFEVNLLEEASTGTTTTTTTKATTTTEGSGGAVNLQISSLSCALTVFLIATKYLY